ncbi:hypothetical protein BH10PLA2_BH10PLA2_20040 [soil metagenome]
MASVCELPVHAEAGISEQSIELNRRGSERFRCNWYPTVCFLARTTTLIMGRGVIRDVSRTGMGLISELSLAPGTVLAIQLRSAENGFSDMLSASVVHCGRQADGSFLLGCHLSRRLSNTEMDAILR